MYSWLEVGGRIQSLDGSLILLAMVNKTVNSAYSGPLRYLRSGYEVLRAIWGPVWEGVREVDLRVILGPFWVHLRVISEKPHRIPQILLHLAVGRALKAKYDEIRVLGHAGWGTGIAPPPTHPAPLPRVHPPLPRCLHGSRVLSQAR